MPPRNTDADLWRFVNFLGPVPESCPELGRCFLWEGATRSGYGVFKVNYKQVQARRLAYELSTKQPLPHEMNLEARCQSRLCVRPDHMEAVTFTELLLRRYAKVKNGSENFVLGR